MALNSTDPKEVIVSMDGFDDSGVKVMLNNRGGGGRGGGGIWRESSYDFLNDENKKR